MLVSMKTTHNFLFVVLAGAILVSACHKETETVNSTPNPPTPPATVYSKKGLRQLFSPLQPAMQSFNVPAGVSTTITGAQGTRLTFYPNSFKNAAGQVVTSGTVQIKLMEATKPGAMIGARAATIMATGGLLRSGGEIYVSATMGGQELKANKYRVSFAQPAYSNQPMELYYGDMNNEDSVVVWTGTNGSNGTTSTGTRFDSTQGQTWRHQFDSCTSFNWINCDHFYSSTPITNVSAIAPDTSFNGSNTSVFIVFPSINSVCYMSSYVTATHTFSLSTGYYVPVGMNMHIIGISVKNGNYYYSELLNQTISNNMSMSLNLQQQTLTYLQSHLTAL